MHLKSYILIVNVYVQFGLSEIRRYSKIILAYTGAVAGIQRNINFPILALNSVCTGISCYLYPKCAYESTKCKE